MDKLFVTHYHFQNQIPFAISLLSLGIILPFLLLLILITLERKKGMAREEFFTFDGMLMLRGIAIIFLIIGHLALKCLEGVLPLDFAGTWAVIIFLTISGIGLAKRYGLKDCGIKFFRKRLERLMFPVWITLTFFYCLDFFLRGSCYPFSKVTLSYIGIISPGPPNGPAWFVSYIIFLYTTYYLVSLMEIHFHLKVLILMAISFIVGLLNENVTLLRNYFGIWTEYTVVFPIAVVVGMYHRILFSFLAYLFSHFKLVYIGLTILFWVVYLTNSESSGIFEEGAYVHPRFFLFLNPVFLIVGIILLGFLLDMVRIRSKVLLTLGKYSFEIYLLHLPFMEYYDFFLFRPPLFVFFFIYLLFILIMAYFLKISTSRLNGLIFR